MKIQAQTITHRVTIDIACAIGSCMQVMCRIGIAGETGHYGGRHAVPTTTMPWQQRPEQGSWLSIYGCAVDHCEGQRLG